MSVFVFDQSSGLVKITKRGKKYYVYRLKEVQEIPIKGHSWFYKKRTFGSHTYKFIWEPTASDALNYKPYDDGDVSSNPDMYVYEIRRWNPYKIRKMI